MGVRHRERAYVRRRELIEKLGGRCKNCGTKGTEDPRRNPLEIHHVNGRTYDVRKMDSSWRIAVYEREYREGVELEVLCKRCNASVGDPLRHAAEA